MVGRRAAPSVATSDDIVHLTAIAITTGEGGVERWIFLLVMMMLFLFLSVLSILHFVVVVDVCLVDDGVVLV